MKCQAQVARLGHCDRETDAYFCDAHWTAFQWRETRLSVLRQQGYLPKYGAINPGVELDLYEAIERNQVA